MSTSAPLLDPVTEPFQKPAQLAQRWKMNHKTVLDAIRKNEIPVTRIGRKILIPTAWVLAQERVTEPHAS